jgi:hypothetical protein
MHLASWNPSTKQPKLSHEIEIKHSILHGWTGKKGKVIFRDIKQGEKTNSVHWSWQLALENLLIWWPLGETRD